MEGSAAPAVMCATVHGRALPPQPSIDSLVEAARGRMQPITNSVQVRTPSRSVGDARRECEREACAAVRWMFGFWIATLAPLAGLILALQ